MIKSVMATGAAVMMAGAASAQTPPMSSNGAAPPAATVTTSHMSVRQRIQGDLGKDGYTNVTIIPSSFFVHATNKQGQPVAMIITPDSVTEVVETGGNGGSQSNGPAAAGNPGASTQK